MKIIKEYKKKYYVTEAQEIVNEMHDFKDKKKEFFVVFYLDTKNKIMAREIIHIGTLNTSIIHPREIFRNAIIRACAKIIIAHNHPSGDPTPSREDKKITEELEQAGELLRIRLVDHVIYSDKNNYYSFRAHKFDNVIKK